MRYIYLLLCVVWVYVNISITEAQLIPVLKPFQSSNSVMYNDCNLPLNNIWLLLKRFGNDPLKSYPTTDMIIFAYNKTVWHPDCGWKWEINEKEWTTSFIDNLCTVYIDWLSKMWIEKYKLTSHPEAKKWRRWVWTSWVSENGSAPWFVEQLVLNSLWSWTEALEAYSSPEKCGVLPDMSLSTAYSLWADSIFKIASDCDDNKPYNPNRSTAISTLLSSKTETPWVFGLQNWGSNNSTEIERCQQRISQAYINFIKAAKNIDILQTNKFIINANKAYIDQAVIQLDTEAIDGAWLVWQVWGVVKETPTTQFCEVK